MKNLIICIFVLFLFSCSDNSPETIKTEENHSISSGDTLELFLARARSIEGGFSISQQAQHFSISEIQHRENGLFYIYAPEEGFTGTDIVRIIREDSNGAEIYSQTITTVLINVTE